MKNKKLYLNSTLFLIVACIFILCTVSIGIKNYRSQMKQQLMEISKNDLRSNTDFLVRSINTRLNTAENAMKTLIDTYPNSTNIDFGNRVDRLSYRSNAGQLIYYQPYQITNQINNRKAAEHEENPVVSTPDLGSALPLLDSHILDSLEALKTGKTLYISRTGDDGYYLRIVMPVMEKGTFCGILVNGYNSYRYNSLIEFSSYSKEDTVMLLDKNTGFCTVAQDGNTNVNYFDYLQRAKFITGSLDSLKKDFIEGAYGLICFEDPDSQIPYYMTYDNLESGNLIVCNLIPCSYVEQQVSALNASSDDLILVIFSVIFIMIILIFIVQSITTIRIRNNQNRLQLEQDRFHTVMKYTQSAIWEYNIKKNIMEKPDNTIGINLGSAKTPDFEAAALKCNAIYKEDIPVFQDFCKDLRNGKPDISTELRALDMNGNYVWFSIVGNTIFNTKGTPVSVIGQTTNINQEKQEMELLKNLSERDPLTKLYNRKTAQTLIDNILDASGDSDLHAFCMIDVDNFKSINDTFGHIFGDAVLTEISTKLKQAFEKEHIISRYGGDEFTIFIKYAPSIDYIEEKAQLINELLKDIYVGEHAERKITTSVGIAIYPYAGTEQKSLMKHADIALYYSKNAGKSCYHIYNDNMQQNFSVIAEKEKDAVQEESLHKDSRITWEHVDMDLLARVVDFLFDARDLRSSLNRILSLVGSTYQLSHISIEEYSYDQKYVNLSYNWNNPQLKVLSVSYQNKTMKDANSTNYYKHTPSGVFYTDDVFSMDYPVPEELTDTFRQLQLKCLYQCGFAENGIYHGCLQAMICNENSRNWTQQELSTLTMISKIIGGYLLKIHSQEHAKNIEEKDILTNSYNFFKFISVADNIMKQNKNKQYVFAYTDIDMFKYINTTFGYSEGDNVLKQFSEIIRAHLAPGEIYCRVTADKFIIMMHYHSRQETSARMERMMQAWRHIKTLKSGSHRLTIKAGLCITNYPDTATLAIDQANIARKDIQESHKSIYSFFNESMKSTLVKQKEIEDIMDEALLNEEFLVYYQPKFNLSTNAICGAEALVRWKRPDIGLIPPNEFIPIFENNEFIVELDFYMLRKVCMQLRRLLDMGKEPFPISVNFSPIHLRDQDFVLKITNIVDSCQLPRHLIEVELTENALMEDNNDLLATLNTLHELGFRLSMDDFGSGYSSLNLLRILPFDVIKLDKEFFHHGSTTTREQIIISNVIHMLKELNMQIVSEGVETKEQAQFLKDLECNIAQGFLYEQPLPSKEFLKKYFDVTEKS